MPISRNQLLAGAAALSTLAAAVAAAGAAVAQSQPTLPVVDAEPMDIGECRAPTSHAGTDRVLTCSCPARAGDANYSGSVWGSDVYTADSYICTTARHAGVIGDAGGQVTLQMLPGRSSYAGTRRNGVTTKSYGAYRASYRYVTTTQPNGGDGSFSAVVDLPDFDMSMVGTRKKAKSKALGGLFGAVGRATGDRTVREVANVGADLANGSGLGSSVAEDIGQCTGLPGAYWDKPGTLLTCTCPANPSEASPIWGTGIYTGDSAICKAAIHAGAITRAGGRVAIETFADQRSYSGSTHNGLTSMNYGPTRRLGAYRFVK
ncbi:MAG: hypothetical protein IE933_10170 [Sphingomonadales bacterium]|nr:hypothetical protein [Sphingomonadales bacterium]MBD3773322.1 hypothetical protein [Paracoccaceae bacterium]